ncbi:MAG TPA: MlaD family protein [Stellaceae bacterium]|nr:MlaD family protein [Stellaceae bacterium]
MARKTNPKLIGAFVIGAVALVVVAVLAFGGGALLTPKDRAVLFFSGQSLSGLEVGAPVTFQGVKVGEVTDIKIDYDVAAQHLYIPIYIQILPDKFQFLNGERNEARNLQELIKRGLRAQLEVQSLVTGQVSVNFDFHPDTPIVLVGIDKSIPELPTVPSELQALKATVTNFLEKVNKLPLEKIADDVIDVLQTANGTLKDVDAQVNPLGDSFKKTSDQAGRLMVDLDGQVKPLADSFKATSDQADRLLTNADADLPPLVAGALQAMKSATTAFNQADQTLRTAQNLISPESPVYFEVLSTLREIKSAVSSIHALADYLERNPNALLIGKK